MDELEDDDGKDLYDKGKKIKSLAKKNKPDELGDDIGEDADGDADADKKSKSKKQPVLKAAETWNPMTQTFEVAKPQRSFSKSLMENIMTRMILKAEGTPTRRDPGELYNNPLNLVAIENLIKESKPVYEYDQYMKKNLNQYLSMINRPIRKPRIDVENYKFPQ